jgi:hypothetical protein
VLTLECVAQVFAKDISYSSDRRHPHKAGLGADSNTTGQAAETRVQALIPDLERQIASGMKAFDVPGLAIGIIGE